MAAPESIHEYLSSRSRYFHFTFTALLLALVGAVDFATGFEVSLSVFYLLPVAYGAWFIGQEAGIGCSVVAAGTRLGTNLLAGQAVSHPLVPVWNLGVHLGFLLTVTYLLGALGRVLEGEQALSRTDPSTGCLNSRAFYELLAAESARAARHPSPYTLVYLDIDNFKKVNDTYGHSVGDATLGELATVIGSSIRRTDALARLGGDEFALLLLDTDQPAAVNVIEKLRWQVGKRLGEAPRPLTLSIGVVVVHGGVPRAEVLNRADALMYEAKAKGKDNVVYGSLEAPPPVA